MLDMSSFEAYVPDDARHRVRRAWLEAWKRARPGADPERAHAVIEPIAALRRAVIYQRFLDGIETSERRYHASDVPDWLRAALRSASNATESSLSPREPR
jgi:hypothetical protein